MELQIWLRKSLVIASTSSGGHKTHRPQAATRGSQLRAGGTYCRWTMISSSLIQMSLLRRCRSSTGSQPQPHWHLRLALSTIRLSRCQRTGGTHYLSKKEKIDYSGPTFSQKAQYFFGLRLSGN